MGVQILLLGVRSKIGPLGWSLGAWAIMDLFSMNFPQDLPPNPKISPAKPLTGVKSAILFYSFCDAGRSRGRAWAHDIDVHMLMGGKDAFTQDCLDIVSKLKDKRQPVSVHVYPSADHGFYIAPEDSKYLPPGITKIGNPEAMTAARERIKAFLSETL